jgi:hypothetical protein
LHANRTLMIRTWKVTDFVVFGLLPLLFLLFLLDTDFGPGSGSGQFNHIEHAERDGFCERLCTGPC